MRRGKGLQLAGLREMSSAELRLDRVVRPELGTCGEPAATGAQPTVVQSAPISSIGRVGRCEHADDFVSVDQFDTPELPAPFAPLKAADRDEPRPDDTRRCRPADRHLMVGEDRSLLLDPAAEIGGTAVRDDVRLAVAPMLERAAVDEAGRERAAPMPAEVLAVVELQGDAEIVVCERRVLRQA